MENIKFVERINETLKKMEISKNKFYDDLCLANNSTTTWKKSIPAADTTYKIARYLNVSMEWLLTGEERKEIVPKELLKFNDLSDDHKAAVLAVINSFYEQENIDFVKKNARG